MYISKIIGYLLILAGCSGMGIWYSIRMQQKVWHLKEMIRILDMVMSEIDYGRSTLPECCERIWQKAPTPYGEIFQEIYENSQQESGVSFGEMSGVLLQQGLREIPMEKEKEVFIRCFSDVGYADEWMQLRTIERGKAELQESLRTEEEDLKKRSKLAVSLGTMSGILMVLILL